MKNTIHLLVILICPKALGERTHFCPAALGKLGMKLCIIIKSLAYAFKETELSLRSW